MKNGQKIALGGVMSALSLMLMMLTGLIPASDYSLPAIAGVALVPVAAELGRRWGLLCWGAVSLLSVFLVPVKESALLYVVFLGYYPIIKSLLENGRGRVVEWALKLLCFNASIGGTVGVVTWLWGIQLFDLALPVPAALAIVMAVLNGTFILYDIALTRLITAYYRYFRPKYIKRIFK